MLRVCPVISTPHPQPYAELFLALGLRPVADAAPWQLFDSGNGKIAVARGPVALRLEFELRDARIFVQRTLADGTPAQLVGTAAQVTAPGNFTFLARPVQDVTLPDDASALSVTVVWNTPHPMGANTVLANIGAKHVRDFPSGGALFRAKNGGFVRTAAGAVSGVELQVDAGGTEVTRHTMPDGAVLSIAGGADT